MRVITILFGLLVCLSTTICLSEELNLDSLQKATRGAIFPEVCVREITEPGDRRLVLLTTIAVHVRTNRVDLLNPFGEESIGRCYRVSVIDAKGTVHRDIVSATPLKPESFETHWLQVYSGGLVGRAHELAADALSGLPSGEYSLVLLLHHQMLYRTPSNPDAPLFCSPPVPFTINAQGVPEFRDVKPFQQIEVDPRVNLKNDLALTLKLINPEPASLVIPGMNIFSPLDKPVAYNVTKEDGSPYKIHSRLRGGTSGGEPIMREKYAVNVPKDGIVGGVLPYAGTLEPGRFRVVVQVNESIYKDKLFVNGRMIGRKRGEWPISFQSEPTEVVVPESQAAPE